MMGWDMKCLSCGDKFHTGAWGHLRCSACLTKENKMTKPDLLPDDLERLLCNYTRNDRNSINRFLGAAEQCGYTLTRMTSATPDPQSDMVAVPREVIEEAAASIRFALNMDNLSDAEFSKLDLSLAMLQPYTKETK